jgi:hypothetical protein
MTTPRFVDGLGAVPGAGFRAWGRVEWLRPRGELWRLQTALRGFGEGQDGFTRSSSSLYYRFPAAKNAGLAFSRVSLSAARNADDRGKILDGWDALVGLNFGKVRTTWTFALDEYTKDDAPIPFPDPTNVYVLQEWKLSAEAAFSVLFCTVTAKTGLVKKLDAVNAEWKEAEIPFSLSLQLRGGPGRLTLKASSARFPSDWTAGISWRLRLP